MEQEQKKKTLIIIASCAGALLVCAFVWFLFFAGQFKTYYNPQYKFAIKYPGSWFQVKPPKGGEAVAVIFVKPKDTALDKINENFNITVQAVPPHLASLQNYSDKIRQQMLAVFKKNIKIVEDKDIKLGGRLGHMINFEAATPDSIQLMTAWVMRKDQAYLLTFLGDMKKFKKNKLLIEEMLRSFELK